MPKAENASDIGADRSELAGREKDRLDITFERSLEDTRAEDTAVLVEKIQEYRNEINVVAEVAKSELSGSYHGQSPDSGNFGMTFIEPGYFGYDSWYDAPDATGGAAFDWIDDDTPTNLGSGSSGFANPVTIGDSVVHVILGFGTYNPDSVVTRIKEEKNDNPKPAVSVGEQFRNSDLQIAWLDSPTVLQPDDTYAVRGFAGGEVGDTYSIALRPVGVTFIEAKKARILDYADMAGTSDSDVVVET